MSPTRSTLCCGAAAVLVLLTRAALLPVWPPPAPSIYDEFSYLLQADTFAHGRLTNPTHPMWPFFESIYILQKPSYASRYPPGQALIMAAGQRVFGHPWYGVWLSCGLLAAALCWALQGWLPLKWALLGSAVSLQLCFFSYWMNSYWGGAVAAIGGALVAGAYVRGSGWALGLGGVILMLTRPFEGLLLLTPVLVALAVTNRSRRVWLPMVVCGVAGASWMTLYNYRVTGHPLHLPYREYFLQYETVPPFNVLPLAPANSRTFRHFDLEWLDKGWMLDIYRASRSWRFLVQRPRDWYNALKVVLGSPVWIIGLAGFAPRLLRSRETRFPAWLACACLTGSLVEVSFYPHYAAPFTAVILILTVQSLRYMRPLVPILAVLVFGYLLWTDASLIYRRRTPDAFKSRNSRRGEMERRLLGQSPGKHVIFVHYTGTHSPHEEWIYNGADIDGSPVVWAQDMGETENLKLMRYFRGRAFWRFQPDEADVPLDRLIDHDEVPVGAREGR